MQYFEYLFNPQYSSTVWIYNFIFFSVSFFAIIAHKNIIRERNLKKKSRKGKTYFFLSFLIAWFFYAFNNTGTDLSQYLMRYSMYELDLNLLISSSDTMELGYRLLNALLHEFIENAYLGIGVIKTFIIGIFFISIYNLRDEINVGLAVTAFMALFYFQAFNLIRISLAGSVCFAAFVFAYRRKYLLSMVFSFLAVTFHRSALLFLSALIFYFAYLLFRKSKSVVKLALVALVPLIIIFGKDILVNFISSSDSFDRYENYLEITSTAGVAQLVFYLPVFIMLIVLSCTRLQRKKRAYDLNFVWIVFGFSIAMLGYNMGILARASIFFAPVFVVFMPYYVRIRESGIPVNASVRFESGTLKSIIWVYFFFRYILVIASLFIPSGLYNYSFCF